MFDDYGIDYSVIDAERDANWQRLEDRLPWLTSLEMGEVCTGVDFPGIYASDFELLQFTQIIQATSTRMLQCRLQTSGVTLPVYLELVRGQCLVQGDQGLEPIGFEGIGLFIFSGVKGAQMSAILEDGVATLLHSGDVHRTVEALFKNSMLPPLVSSRVAAVTAA